MPELTSDEIRAICDEFAREVEVVAGGPAQGAPEAIPFPSDSARNIILYGPPGTGKTYRSASLALELLDSDIDLSDRAAVTEAFRLATSAGSIAFVTFHQSYSYEDFVEGIRPVLTDETGTDDLAYRITPGVFKTICSRARMHPGDAFVLIIDEINRGNVSGVLGELITLIEDDKRLGKPEALTAILPYSRESFGVPDNLFILGTMNTADRSLTGLDVALRRRFEFREMPPEVELFVDAETSDLWTISDVPIGLLLRKLNERLFALRGSDYLVGHAFFMPLADENRRNLVELAAIFRRKVLPLLREYFFDDPESIMRVLGQVDTAAQPWNLIQQANSPLAGIDKMLVFEASAVDSADFYRQVAGLPLSVDVSTGSDPTGTAA